MADNIIQAGKFLREQLRVVEPQIIRTVYPEMWGFEGKHHTVKNNLSFGVNEIATVRVDAVGKAVNFGGRATDIPLANFGIDSDSYSTLMGVLGAEWHWTELEQQELASKSGMLSAINVVEEYSKALEKGLREWVHLKTLFGDAKISNFTGLFNSADVDQVILTDNLYTMSSRDLYLYIKSIVKDFKKGAKLTATASDMLVTSDLYDKLTNPIQQNTATDGEVNPYELLTNPMKGSNLKGIYEVNELQNQTLIDYGKIASNATYDMFMLYESSGETLDKLFSGIYKTPVQLKDDGMTYRTTGIVKISEVRMKMPFRVKYYLYPKFGS